MNILLVNDDGIDAIGLRKLLQAINKEDDVYICAPHTEQSASGHGITIGKIVYIEDVEIEGATAAIAMEGEPADCVKIGLEVYKDRGIEMDIVFAGFNHGMNLGTDTLYSGTVSAAIEGALGGLPAVALSISSNFKAHKEPAFFDVAMKTAEHALKLIKKSMSAKESGKELSSSEFINQNHSIFNINIPDLPEEEVKGVKIVPLGYREYKEWFMSSVDENGRTGYHYSGRPLAPGEGTEDSSDIVANNLGYITVTPLQFDFTNYRALDETKDEWKNALGEMNVRI